jgi:hypothetical protein
LGILWPFLQLLDQGEITKGGSITVPLTSCLTGLDWPVLRIKTKIVICHTGDSKPVKEEVNGTMILPPLVFPGPGFKSMPRRNALAYFVAAPVTTEKSLITLTSPAPAERSRPPSKATSHRTSRSVPQRLFITKTFGPVAFFGHN